ncbi:MAG: hypothetical protein ACK4PI_12370 [Tepidisphaerales bacterium]
MPDPLVDNPLSGHATPPDLPPTLAEPPPVRLLAIADVTLLCPPSHEPALDRLYLDILRFLPADPALKPPAPNTFAAAQLEKYRLPGAVLPSTQPVRPTPPLPRVYRAENHALIYQPIDRIRPEHFKLIQLQVPSHAELIERLSAAQLPYQVIRGLMPGVVHVELSDPAGHLLQIFESPMNMPL